jgi:hypothetical protein
MAGAVSVVIGQSSKQQDGDQCPRQGEGGKLG